MKKTLMPTQFQPVPPDAAGVISWIHIGDPHMVRAGEQNDLDLQGIVKVVNRCFADSVCFVYLPGDIADDGSRGAYLVVRSALDKLEAPWCAIVGDHDVHEKSLANYAEHIRSEPYYAFTAGRIRFLALNAFDIPHPASFSILTEQLGWLEGELRSSQSRGERVVLLLHCYPTDLKTGAEELIALIRRYEVRLIDMGHTHYNEIANDGKTIYTATRSTGQIEEGPAGFSVTNFDGEDTSWRFFELGGELPAVMITCPTDERLMTPAAAAVERGRMRVRAKIWSTERISRVEAWFGDELDGRRGELSPVSGSRVWEGFLSTEGIGEGVHSLRVEAEEAGGSISGDTIRVLFGNPERCDRHPRDQDNAIGAWPEHGLLGTQLGPNKNGRKW